MNYTRTEATQAIAEKVMGWCKHDYDVSWQTLNNIKKPSGALCRKCNEHFPLPTGDINRKFYDWNPLTDANHALEALEVYCRSDLAIPNIELADDGWMITFDQFVAPFRWNGKQHKSLPHAICEALLSAVDGEQATIKDGE